MKNFNSVTFSAKFMFEKLPCPRDSFVNKLSRRIKHAVLFFQHGLSIPEDLIKNLYSKEKKIQEVHKLRRQRRILNLITVHLEICIALDLWPRGSVTDAAILEMVDDPDHRPADRRNMLMVTRFPYREVVSMMLASGDLDLDTIKKVFGGDGRNNPVDLMYQWVALQDQMFNQTQTDNKEEFGDTLPVVY